MEKSRFALIKWYLDCVSDDGQVFIGYAAILRWRALRIAYSSVLERRRDETIRARSSLIESSFPEVRAGSIHWHSPQLGVAGTWDAAAPPIDMDLYSSDIGCIRWECLQPRAKCHISAGEKKSIDGLGYAERLTMSIPPWRLPIRELRWGRFLSDSDALVWIDWRGEVPLRLVFYNGMQLEKAVITDRELSLGPSGPVLKLQQAQVLREGPIARTALSSIPGIKKLMPVQTLQSYECKWLSRGLLSGQNSTHAAGWAIHEIVRFQPIPQ